MNTRSTACTLAMTFSLVFTLAACSGNSDSGWPIGKPPTRYPDQGSTALDDSRSRFPDQGAPPIDAGTPVADRGVPLDQHSSTPDAGTPSPDIGTGFDTIPSSVKIGFPCQADADCGTASGASCLLSGSAKTGVCTLRCTTADDPTTLVNEDDCPNNQQNVCGSVKLANGMTVGMCFARCSPRLGANGCYKPLACLPEAGPAIGLFNGDSICRYDGCQSDADCPVRTATICDAKTPCPGGEPCVDGRCAKPGNCDLASGLCAPRKTLFNSSATVGATCKQDSDCGAAMFCLFESTATERSEQPGGASCQSDSECCSGSCKAQKCSPGPCVTQHRNGYCTIAGCASPALIEARCPAGSSCNRNYWSGLCQLQCQLGVAGSCRGVAADKLGDYECRAWNNINFGAGTYTGADSPVCDFGYTVRCESWPLSCEDLGDFKNGAYNPTNMSCRDLNNTKLTNPSDPFGFCLDDTSSGSI